MPVPNDTTTGREVPQGRGAGPALRSHDNRHRPVATKSNPRQQVHGAARQVRGSARLAFQPCGSFGWLF